MIITRSFLNSLPPPGNRRHFFWCEKLPGFGVMQLPSGGVSFVFRYRIGSGRAAAQKTKVLGRHPQMTPEEARADAKTFEAHARLGRDLDAEGKAVRAKVTSMTALCDRYIDVHVPKKRSGAEDERRIKSHIKPEFGERDIRTIQYADIEDLHKKISKTAPVEANRVLALLSKMFSLAIRWQLTEANPCTGVERNHEEPRQRYLTPDELEKLIAAIDNYEAKSIDNRPTCDAIRLLILTGARKMEVLSARWDMFELGVELPKWVKPSSHTKQMKIHYVPLSDAAIELIADMRESRRSKMFLFPGSGKTGHMTEIRTSAMKAATISASAEA
jgi:integrase